MPFRALYELYGRLETDPDYDIAMPDQKVEDNVGFVVVLEPDGRLFDIQPLLDPKTGKPRSMVVLGTKRKSGKGINPQFLYDRADYLLGFVSEKAKKSGKDGKCRLRFFGFRDYHLRVQHDINVPEFDAVCRFLKDWNPDRCGDYAEIISSGCGVFQVRGQSSYVHDHPAIQSWWRERTQCTVSRMQSWWEESDGDKVVRGQCSVTGKDNQVIARLHPKILNRNVTLVSYNEDAFYSRGMEQSINASISVDVATKYVAALNALLSRDDHRVWLGNTLTVYWTDRPTVLERSVGGVLGLNLNIKRRSSQSNETNQRIHAVLSALRKGKKSYVSVADDPGRTGFHILGMTLPENKGRATLRFYHRSTVSDFLDRLRDHFDAIRIERQHPDQPEFPPLDYLIERVYPKDTDTDGKKKKYKGPVALWSALLDSVLTGKRYPDALLFALLRRIVAEMGSQSGSENRTCPVNYPRAALIKGILTRNYSMEIPVSLDTERKDLAYLMGRLFAVLENAQETAHGRGNLNSTIRDKFYTTASASPALIFPMLLRLHQHHLKRMDGGAEVNCQKLVGEILDKVGDFPMNLPQKEQGLFALGYYHQRNDLIRKAIERSNQKKADADNADESTSIELTE